jgi:hypothetical protein
MAQILAYAALEGEGFGRRRGGLRGIAVINHRAVQAFDQIVQGLERVVADAARDAGEVRDRRVELRQRRFAQIQARRKPLDRADHHAVGILRIHLALDRDSQFRQRTLGAEPVGDIAEGVLVLVELAILRHVDAPVLDILAVVIARREPQRLDHAARRLLIAIDSLVRNPDAHRSSMKPIVRALSMGTACGFRPNIAVSARCRRDCCHRRTRR